MTDSLKARQRCAFVPKADIGVVKALAFERCKGRGPSRGRHANDEIFIKLLGGAGGGAWPLGLRTRRREKVAGGRILSAAGRPMRWS